MITPCLPAISDMVVPISRIKFILHERSGEGHVPPGAFDTGATPADGG